MSYIEPTKREIKMEYCFANDIEMVDYLLIPEPDYRKYAIRLLQQSFLLLPSKYGYRLSCL